MTVAATLVAATAIAADTCAVAAIIIGDPTAAITLGLLGTATAALVDLDHHHRSTP